FDPRRGPVWHFVEVVLAHAASDLLRERHAAKRDYRRLQSLDKRVPAEGGPAALADAVGAREYDARRLRHPRPPEELAQLRTDVKEAPAKLPPPQRPLPERLRHGSVSQAARDLGLPRTTADEARRRLARRLRRAGLHHYLDNPPST